MRIIMDYAITEGIYHLTIKNIKLLKTNMIMDVYLLII